MLPVTIVTSLDDTLRDSATAAAAWDVDGVVVLRHDLGPTREEGLRRVVTTSAPGALGAVLEDVRVPLEHACLGCALREDVLPVVAALARAGRHRHLVLALPVAAEPLPALQALAVGTDGGDALADLVTVVSVVAVVDGAGLVEDLLGEDLLAERGLGLLDGDGDGGDGGAGEERSVGEVLAHQLDEADLVLTSTALPAAARTLLAHTSRAPLAGLHETTGADLLAHRRHDPRDAVDPLHRSDLRAARPTGAADADGVFTLDLRSPLPLHPQRLLDDVEALGAGELRARGVFWLPTRPDAVCGWDGAGGQLSIGGVGEWAPQRGERRETRLVVTGVAAADAARVRAAFERVLVTPAELARWTREPPAEDGFEAWLGPVDERADAR